MNPITRLLGKTIRYLQNNGIQPTIKKVLRYVRKNDWLSSDDDHLYDQSQCKVDPREHWEMPALCLPYKGTISVIIPSYNGAHELPALLEALLSQVHIQNLEIVVVDSGSSDGTPELAEKYGAKLIRIKQEEFSHSYSRMLGATNATGEYLLFMTQDALPDREDWIIRMLQPCLVSDAAAVSCYETPKEDADLLSHITVWNWKNVMSGGSDRLTALPKDCSYDNLRRSAQLSDNACLVKRSIFMELGGHRGAYAEDLDLGIRLLKAGYKLGILSSISVVHSHNRPALYNFKRAIVDGVNIAKIFDDFTLDALTPQQAMNRMFTAACANRMFLDELKSITGELSPNEFAEFTRTAYNRIIVSLKKHSVVEIAELLFAEDGDLNDSVRNFLEDLWKEYGAHYTFDGGLAAIQGRYIMHTLCPYLDHVHRAADSSLLTELKHLLWQYYGQSAGYCVAAAYLHTKNTDHKICDTVRKYSVGV